VKSANLREIKLFVAVYQEYEKKEKEEKISSEKRRRKNYLERKIKGMRV
jgi:hypothetical protein